MANKFIAKKTLSHYYDSPMSSNEINDIIDEVDKSKTISELSRKELYQMLERVRSERELQQLIKDMKRNSGEKCSYEEPWAIDTVTPINKLYHHGISGMRWGVRRYQHDDGTRTPAGKRRDREDASRSEEHTKDKKSKPRLADLSNEELRSVNERMQLEDTYKRLTSEQRAKGESWVKKSLATAGEQAFSTVAKGVMIGGAKLLIKELSPQFADAAFGMKETKKSS